jgi:hypothetical protein
MSGVCGKYGGLERYRMFVRRPNGKGLLGRPKRRWDDDIKIRLKDVRWGGMDWIAPAEDRDRWQALVSAVMNLWVP